MNPLNDQLALAPLGAADLIDRAVRMYRQYFFTLIRIAAPPTSYRTLIGPARERLEKKSRLNPRNWNKNQIFIPAGIAMVL